MAQLALVSAASDAPKRRPLFDDGEPLLFEHLLARADLLMPLSEPSRRALTLLDRDDVSLRAIGALVEGDTAVAVGLVRLANSSFYRGVRDVLDVTAAMTRLGRRNTRELIFALSILRPSPLQSQLARAVRATALCSAASARVLAEQLGRKHADELFFICLIQDVGQMLLALATPKSYAAAVQEQPTGPLLLERERSWAGFTHVDVGAALMERWGMPEVLIAHVREHHDPVDVAGTPVRAVTRLAHTLGAALAQEALGRKAPTVDWRADPVCALLAQDTSVLDAVHKDCARSAKELLERFGT